MKPIAYVLAAAVVCMGGSALIETARADAPSPAPSASDAASPEPVSVDTKDYAYVPGTVTVPVGTKVIFKNSDAVAHTVTADDKTFDSKDMNQGQTWSHVFATAGTYTYMCVYHSTMHGKIVVK